MRGTMILIVFFLIFTCASILIPSPMFPGNMLVALAGESAYQYTGFMSSVVNGIFYGAILWLVFVG
jgi:hypothetical protein